MTIGDIIEKIRRIEDLEKELIQLENLRISLGDSDAILDFDFHRLEQLKTLIGIYSSESISE